MFFYYILFLFKNILNENIKVCIKKSELKNCIENELHFCSNFQEGFPIVMVIKTHQPDMLTQSINATIRVQNQSARQKLPKVDSLPAAWWCHQHWRCECWIANFHVVLVVRQIVIWSVALEDFC